MQLMCVEYARNVAGMKDANTTEINPETKYPIIDILAEQVEKMAKKELSEVKEEMQLLKSENKQLKATVSVLEKKMAKCKCNPEEKIGRAHV